MAFYNGGLSTHLIDPVFNRENFQSEFRLNPNTVYLSNMRLANVGCTVKTGETGPYNALTGAYGVIKSIQLYDDNTLLDQILELPIWMAFSNYNHPNERNRSVNDKLSQNGMGFGYLNDGVKDATDTNVFNIGSIQQFVASTAANVNDPQNGTTPTPTGWLDLQRLLPFLSSPGARYIPTTLFKNLRLVVQYDSTAANITPSKTGSEPKSTEPFLIVDELMSSNVKDKVSRSKFQTQFNPIEHDRVTLPLGAGGAAVQQNTFTLHGFDNKYVGRFLMVNTPVGGQQADTGGAYGKLGSVAQVSQTVQIRVNGQNKLPSNGISKPNERLAYLNDTWGTCNTYTGANVSWLYALSTADDATQASGVFVKDPLVRVGQLDYFGMTVTEMINDLEIEYSRKTYDGGGATAYKQELNLNCFAQTRKAVLQDGKGSYNVVYV